MAHPYRSLPFYTRWSRAIAEMPMSDVDPVVSFPFTIKTNDKVATAGSCFAQHIARHLKKNGFSYFVVEDGHPLGTDGLRAEFNYGVFSARYGNIYTARQLLQLFERAFGSFEPIEDHWKKGDKFLDPLRPAIQPDGFASLEELKADRHQHLAAVRQMFQSLDYFVFTLGLTECWQDRRDGTVFPICPGVAGGSFDENVFAFRNLTVQEVVGDMAAFLRAQLSVNPRTKMILTVSPVPLIATAIDRHVLVSTIYSKSVLRVACDELCEQFGNIAYFPSYEIITGNYTRSGYFAPDLRSITEDGVEHVMRLFLRHATDGDVKASPNAHTGANVKSDEFVVHMADIAKTICEEELIEAAARGEGAVRDS